MTDKDNAFVLQGAVGLDGPQGDQVGFKNQKVFFFFFLIKSREK